MHRLNNEEVRVLREIRYAYPCCLCCFCPHPNNCDVVTHPVKICSRRSANVFSRTRSEYVVCTCMLR